MVILPELLLSLSSIRFLFHFSYLCVFPSPNQSIAKPIQPLVLLVFIAPPYIGTVLNSYILCGNRRGMCGCVAKYSETFLIHFFLSQGQK